MLNELRHRRDELRLELDDLQRRVEVARIAHLLLEEQCRVVSLELWAAEDRYAEELAAAAADAFSEAAVIVVGS